MRSTVGAIPGAGVESALREAVRSILDATDSTGEIRPAFERIGVIPDVFDHMPSHAKVALRYVARRVLAPVLDAGGAVDAAVFTAAQAAAPGIMAAAAGATVAQWSSRVHRVLARRSRTPSR